jgi:hypothetical protein
MHAMPARPVLHGDNGTTLKATTVLAMLHWLGIKPSYSHPRVSDDNAFAEALFRTAKYRPEFPLKGFADLDAARQWAARFVHWYNQERCCRDQPIGRSNPKPYLLTDFPQLPERDTNHEQMDWAGRDDGSEQGAISKADMALFSGIGHCSRL